jgi:tetratricopeptide (TPR) repeat protein
MGADIDREVRNAQRETRLLKDEVDRLQRQLEQEWQQSAEKLGLCAELKRELAEAREAAEKEASAREYWQQECGAFEERHDLLESKLAAIELTEAEAKVYPALPPAACATLGLPAPPMELRENGTCDGAFPEEIKEALAMLEKGDDATVERYLDILQGPGCGEKASCEANEDIERPLHRLHPRGIHALLVGAASRQEKGGSLLRRIVRLWVGQLVGWGGGQALRDAAWRGSTEAVATLLALGGTPGAIAAAGTQRGPSDQCLLSLAVERGDAALLKLLLEHSSGPSSPLLAAARRAFTIAREHGKEELANLIAGHLTVELSLLGNSRYRRGEYETAIESYEEAIGFCDATTGAAPTARADRDDAPQSSCENLVRLRYNLARALHRTERWTESRHQATIVLRLNPGYVNALALRAQSAMAVFDWAAAKTDLEQLLASASSPSAEAAPPCEDTIVAWKRRLDECARQLAMGHYETLELPPFSSTDAVRKAYHEMARQWHPDKHRQKPQDHLERAERRFRRAREAVEVLGDEVKKHEYDETLRGMEADVPTAVLRQARQSRSETVEAEPSRTARGRARSESPPEARNHSGASPTAEMKDTRGAAEGGVGRVLTEFNRLV